MDPHQLADLIGSVLGTIPYPWMDNDNCYSRAAKKLVLGTIVHESDGGQYVRQVGGGPGVGIAQLEPFTVHDHYDYMKKNKNWRNWGLTRQAIKSKYMVSDKPDPEELVWNNALSICLCRVHYLRSPHSLPPYDDLDATARYWANHYNKGDNIPEKIKEFKEDYKHFVGDFE